MKSQQKKKQIKSHTDKYLSSFVMFSPCEKYRYELGRIWDFNKPYALFCMLNPSTADLHKNDPTVERCERRARLLNYGGLVVVNIFAYRSTDPQILYDLEDPSGPKNNEYILKHAQNAGIIICGWGKHGILHHRGNFVIDYLRSNGHKLFALKINKDGSPAHPLYIGYKNKPILIK